ncbi:MAG TPA: DUF3363 domain-containing protein [Ancylobacter sp.]
MERFGVAEEIEPGRWTIAERAESTLRAIGEREDILRTHTPRAGRSWARRRARRYAIRHPWQPHLSCPRRTRDRQGIGRGRDGRAVLSRHRR